MNTDEARARFHAIQAECDRDGLRYHDIDPNASKQDNEAFARDIQASLGLVWEHAQQGLIALEDTAPVPEPEPPPSGPAFPILAGTIFGQTKWLPGSTGCDLFWNRGEPIYAPLDSTIRRIVWGTGIQGGAEIILATPDNAWAWRYRHVYADASLHVGQAVARGQALGIVYDTSLDQLCAPPVQSFPDGWQHLDLSVNRGTDQFSAQGGGGGNTNAYAWLKAIGYTGREMSRTPGPTSCGFGTAKAQAMVAPKGTEGE